MPPSRHDRDHAHSRRDFFKQVMGKALAGASLLEVAQYQAAWAQALAPTASTNLFDIQKVAERVVSTGDIGAAFMGDGYPKDWPATIDYAQLRGGTARAGCRCEKGWPVSGGGAT